METTGLESVTVLGHPYTTNTSPKLYKTKKKEEIFVKNINKLLTNRPIGPVGIPLHVLTLLQVQQAAGPRCSPLRGIRCEGAPQVQDQEVGGGTGTQEKREEPMSDT